MTVEELKKVVGGNIKRERIRHNLTQSALAESTEMSIKQIAAIETGHSYPEAQTLIRLSEALDVPPGFFYRSEADEQAEKERLREHFRNIQTKFDMIVNEEAGYTGNSH